MEQRALGKGNEPVAPAFGSEALHGLIRLGGEALEDVVEVGSRFAVLGLHIERPRLAEGLQRRLLCYGELEEETYAELCAIVRDEIAHRLAKGESLPKPTALDFAAACEGR
ncbi:MAG: hypothetical protein WCL19_03255 [Verrucomicrobiota bacterium]